MWVLNLDAWRSVDGGRTFTQMTTPHGDNHDLWIDPRNPLRMIEGNDGGACVSFNGGASWSTIYNQPTAQFYHVTTDTQFPYRVYGTQQDNTAISVPSRSHKGAILLSDCYPVGSSESGQIAVRPDNPEVVYSGAIGSAPGGGGVLLRYDHGTGPGADHHGLAGALRGLGREGPEVPVPVDVPYRHFPPRPERALRGRRRGVSLHGTRAPAGRPSAPT